jgi:hypothetical protein
MNQSQLRRLADFLRHRFDEGESLIGLNRIIDKLDIGEEGQGELRLYVWTLAKETEGAAPPFASSPEPSEGTANPAPGKEADGVSTHDPRTLGS